MSRGEKEHGDFSGFAEGTHSGKAPEGAKKLEGVLGARLEELTMERKLNEIPKQMKAERDAAEEEFLKADAEAARAAREKIARQGNN